MTTGISAVLDTILQRPASRIPRGELVIDRVFARNYLNRQDESGRAGTLSDCQLLLRIARALQLDLVCIQSEEPGADSPMLSIEADELKLLSECGLFIFWIVGGPFQSLMYREDMMSLLREIARSPEAVGERLQLSAETITSTIRRGVAAGAHGVILAEDIAYRQSTYMSPTFVERYLIPEWRKQVEVVREMAVPIFFHSDGNVSGVLSHIVATGFHGLQCLEPAAGMDMPLVRNQYGNELCLMGNIDPGLLVEQDSVRDQAASRARLQQAVSELLSGMGTSGFIFGTCSGLHGGLSPQLVQDMYALVP